MREAWKDQHWIRDASGGTVTVWSYKPEAGQHIGPDTHFSGIGPGNAGYFADAIERHGHAILESPGSKPWNHHVIGFGVGHDDAQFAESGTSMAAYYESGEAWGGPWWAPEATSRHYYGPLRASRCRHCTAQLTQSRSALWLDDNGHMSCPVWVAGTQLDHEPVAA